ncbi:unnamed protein product [Rotaria sp. Silwood1]|nr:unnamed protein product [Rotaria sp. Silwood1]CAF1675824.1 unnamed protein product [Rotaria sp. Silwood1]CAF3792022.1 unnamed protein product [Rotaria sp. Silwood1]CAF3853100.1 unnamed protein product [Rotaria sp. Silwood1]CAF3940667.1 unnamed protein product [Rotaria sp. Silwood1]
MGHMPGLLLTVLAVVAFFSVSADVVMYTVTFVPCVLNSSCPEGNPSRFNQTFAVNGIISPKLYLRVGDKLVFNLATNVPIHPLSICRHSPLPKFCAGANGTNLLNTPITVEGDCTSFNFTTAGTYYYGCNYHPGMGATIIVFPTSTDSSSSSAHSSAGSSSIPVLKARTRVEYQ